MDMIGACFSSLQRTMRCAPVILIQSIVKQKISCCCNSFNMFSTPTSAVPSADGALGFGIKEEQLTALTRDHNYSGLQQYGGVS